jgi:hypothetical protein
MMILILIYYSILIFRTHSHELILPILSILSLSWWCQNLYYQSLPLYETPIMCTHIHMQTCVLSTYSVSTFRDWIGTSNLYLKLSFSHSKSSSSVNPVDPSDYSKHIHLHSCSPSSSHDSSSLNWSPCFHSPHHLLYNMISKQCS